MRHRWPQGAARRFSSGQICQPKVVRINSQLQTQQTHKSRLEQSFHWKHMSSCIIKPNCEERTYLTNLSCNQPNWNKYPFWCKIRRLQLDLGKGIQDLTPRKLDRTAPSLRNSLPCNKLSSYRSGNAPNHHIINMLGQY